MIALLIRSGLSSARLRSFDVLPAILAVALMLVAAALRFYHLDARSMWLDEVTQAQVIRFQSVGEVLDSILYYSDVAPLPYVLTWLLRGLGGSEWAIRMPSVVAASLNVVAIFYLGRALVSTRAGLFAALFMAITPFGVYYAQEARPYALLMLFSTLQMLFAYYAVRSNSTRAWLAFAGATVLNLYTQYLSLQITAALFLLLAVVLAARVRGVMRKAHHAGSGRHSPLRPVAATLGPALLSVLFILLTYSPWFRYLLIFLTSNGNGANLESISNTHVPTLREVNSIVEAYGFRGVSLVLLVAGFAGLPVWLYRRNRTATLLLALSVTTPLAIYYLRFGGGLVHLELRYLSVLLPVACVITGLGAEIVVQALWRAVEFLRARTVIVPVIVSSALADRSVYSTIDSLPDESTPVHRAGNIVRRGGRNESVRLLGAGVSVVLAALILAGAVPQVAYSYSVPKDDYRSAADYVIANSPPDSFVLVVGRYKDFVNAGVGYYLWLRQSPIKVVNGGDIQDGPAEELARGYGTVWASIFTNHPPPAELGAISLEGLELTSFQGQVLVREKTPHGTATEQAIELLKWASSFDPVLGTSADRLDLLSGHTPMGENVLPAPNQAAQMSDSPPFDRWLLAPGATLENDQRTFRLLPANAELNVLLFTRRVQPGRKYALRFRYRNANLQGRQRVFAGLQREDGTSIGIFPSSLGYRCVPKSDWVSGAFVFSVPDSGASLTIWLRSTGVGTAEFSDVELREVK